MKHHWNSLGLKETSRHQKKERTHENTNWVTSSLLELLIAAKKHFLINWKLVSHQATHLLFKYHISKLDVGVQNFGKPADVILERSLIDNNLCLSYFLPDIPNGVSSCEREHPPPKIFKSLVSSSDLKIFELSLLFLSFKVCIKTFFVMWRIPHFVIHS